MPTGLTSQIIRTTDSRLNMVDDDLPGGSVSSQGTGQARYAGQLGAKVALGPDEILFNSAIGTLYGGIYQYVRFATPMTATPAVGMVCFWDITVAEDLYQVTCDETAPGPNEIAGIVIRANTKGKYGFIQVAGKATVQFRAVLTAAGAIGSAVFAAGAGAGADVATADVLSTGANPTFAQAALMNARYLGVAEAAPTNAGLKIVQLGFLRWRQ